MKKGNKELRSRRAMVENTTKQAPRISNTMSQDEARKAKRADSTRERQSFRRY